MRHRRLHHRLCLSAAVQLRLNLSSSPKPRPFQTAAAAVESQATALPPSPFAHSYSSLLAQCFSPRAASHLHAHLAKLGLVAAPPITNHLISLYSSLGLPFHARHLFDEIPRPGLVSFSALISAYARNSRAKQALVTFCRMHSLSIKANEFTFPTVLKACSMAPDFRAGLQVHALAIVTGFESDVFVSNTLLVLYSDFGHLSDSWKLFDEMVEPNTVTWNALLAGCVKNDRCEEAVGLFGEMVAGGRRPNEFGFSCVLNACTGSQDLTRGRVVHGFLMRLGYDLDPFTANALVDMYVKLADVEAAGIVFESIAQPDIVSWNSFIAGCVLQGNDDLALVFLGRMMQSGMLPNVFTLSSILKACAGTRQMDLGRQIHASLIKAGSESDSFVGVGLVDMYAKCDFEKDAKMAFHLIREPDLVSWNALISGYVHNRNDEEALSLFKNMRRENFSVNRTTLAAVLKSIASLQDISGNRQIHGLAIETGLLSDTHVINGLIDAYGKCGYIEDSGKIFKECPFLDVVSFTSMITAYSQSGQGEEAISLFYEMLKKELKPDSFVCSSLLNACASLSAYEQGKQIHVHILKMGFTSDAFAGNALVNMYAKCGSIEDATLSFCKVPERGVVSWSAMIGGLAQHGHGKKALDLFHRMLDEGVAPNHITLTSVLYACNHAGLVDEGKRYFETMGEMFGIKQTQEHYACMIDLYGRAGKLDAAMELVNSMPFEANASVWGALLGASKVHGNIELGKQAAEMLFVLEPEKSGTHVLLANTYASAGMWDRVAQVRKLMKDSKVKKEPGMSWVELKDKVHTFIVGDRSHERTTEIYAKLEELGDLLSKAGYKPILEVDLHDVGRDEKEVLLSHHSEKLAVAFCLISTPPGVPIRVKKNLRVCRDCHTVFKFVSEIVSREIIIRDINRFHHFRGGSCSCGDYW